MVFRFVTAALLLCAVSAADVIRVARPRPHEGTPPPEAAAAAGRILGESGTPPRCINMQGMSIPCVLDFQYLGGPVISNVKVYAVSWNAAVSPDISQNIGGFYRALTDSEWVDWLTEYSTNINVQAGSHQGRPGTQQIIGRGTFAGSYTLPVLSKTYPACLSPDQLLSCVSDADIENELDFQIRHGNLPVPDANTLYVINFPASVRILLSVRPPALSCSAFCSYHSAYQATYQSGLQDVFYAVVPDLGSNGCQTGCGRSTTFQNTCLVTSHEIAESITDGTVGLATDIDFPLGWYDTSADTQGEAGDMCNQSADTIGDDGLPGCVVGAGCFTVQQIFSHLVWNANASTQPNTDACVTTRFDTNDYSLSVLPNTLTLAPGETSSAIPLVSVVTNGSPQPLTLSVTDIPAGLQVSLDVSAVDAGDTAHLTVSAGADAGPFRDGVLVVRATGATTHSASLLVQLSIAQNDWNLFVSPATAILSPGASQVYTVGGQVTLGTAETVTLSSSVLGLPPGVTAAFNSLTLVPGVSTVQLTLSAAAGSGGVPPSSFAVQGSSSSQPTGHSGTGVVQVNTPPTVAFLAPTAGASLTGVTQVQISATPGANSSVARITLLLDNQTTLSNGTTGNVAWDTRGATNGSHTLTATAFGADTLSASTSVTVTVQNALSDFSLAVSPQNVVVPVGGSVHLAVTTTVMGVAEPITLGFTGLPTGVAASFSPTVVTAGSTSDVTLIASSSTPTAAATPVVLQGTTPAQPMGHSASLTVSVQVPAPKSSGCASSAATSPSPALLLLLGVLLTRRRQARPPR